MAYMGLLRACEYWGSFGAPGLEPVRGKGKPLVLPRELWGVGVRRLDESFDLQRDREALSLVRDARYYQGGR